MSNRQDEKIRLYFSGEFSGNEVSEIMDTFNKIGSTRGISNAQIANDSAEPIPIVQTAFLLIIVFVGAEITKGFFNSIGSELKDKLFQTLRTKKKPFVQFKMHYKHVWGEVNAKPDSNEEWKRVFEIISKAEELAIKAINDDKKIWGIMITYDVNVDGYWDIAKFGSSS